MERERDFGVTSPALPQGKPGGNSGPQRVSTGRKVRMKTRIGVPKEVKNHERRVALTPTAVRQLVAAGHEVVVEAGAGAGIGIGDGAYRAAGAGIGDANAAYQAELLVKVKEPLAAEYARLQAGQVLFSYLHLAANPTLTRTLCAKGVTALAYETVTAPDGSLPLLTPMSEIAGRLSVQVGANALQCAHGGRGVLLAGATGVAPGKVVIIGGGMAGANAAHLAVGLQADVTILDKSPARLAYLRERFGASARVLMATPNAVEQAVLDADLVIGAVLVPGARAPKVISRELLKRMRDGSALVDIAIDQGGCFETSRPTTHDDPTYIEEGVVHYCVTNMPGAVARTATLALSQVLIPFVQALADKGWRQALADDPHLALGMNVYAGRVRHPAVIRSLSTEAPDGATASCGSGMSTRRAA